MSNQEVWNAKHGNGETFVAVMAVCGEFFAELTFDATLEESIPLAKAAIQSVLGGENLPVFTGYTNAVDYDFPVESRIEDWKFYATDDCNGRYARCAWSEIQEAADTRVEMEGPGLGGPTLLARIRKG